jgi:O-antigen/teichoic acid export membrane protein
VKSGSWVFILRISDRGIKLIRTIVLARLLSPDDFGLLGLALVTISAVERFTESGFSHALIQKKGLAHEYIDTAWTLSVIRGVLLYTLLFLIAPGVETFFNTPGVSNIIRVISLFLLLNGFSNMEIVILQKELEFNKQFIYQISGSLADLVVSIILSLLMRNVWALVAGLLAGHLTRFIVAYLTQPRRVKLAIVPEYARELYQFGRWMFLSSILQFILDEGDDVFVGRTLSSTSLGHYQLAYRIANLPSTEYAKLIGKLSFPAYSKIQDDPARLHYVYTRVLKITALFSFLIAGLILSLSRDLIMVLLGDQWIPMITTMQVLTIYGLLSSIAIPGPLFMAVGKPNLRTYIKLFGTIAMVILVPPLTIKYGITGTAIAVTIRVALVDSIALTIALKMVRIKALEIIRIFLPPLASTVLAVLCIVLLKWGMGGNVSLLALTLYTTVGAGVYSGLMFLVDKRFNLGFVPVIKQALGIE